jgi:hypothetical protein
MHRALCPERRKHKQGTTKKCSYVKLFHEWCFLRTKNGVSSVPQRIVVFLVGRQIAGEGEQTAGIKQQACRSIARTRKKPTQGAAKRQFLPKPGEQTQFIWVHGEIINHHPSAKWKRRQQPAITEATVISHSFAH